MPMNIESTSTVSIPGACSCATRIAVSAVADMYAVAGATRRPASAKRSCHVSRTRRTHGASPPVST